MEENKVELNDTEARIDFAESIESLEIRSEKAHRRVKVLGWLLGILVFSLITIAGYFYGLNT